MKAKTSLLLLFFLPLMGCQKQPQETLPPADVPVRSEILHPGPFQASLLLLGKVEPAGRLDVLAPEAGRLILPSRFARGLRTGEPIRRGELLFELRNEDLELRLAEAELSLQAAAAELERAQKGVEGGFMSRAELKRSEIEHQLALKRLDNARQQEQRLQVRAEAEGHLLIEQALPQGSTVSAHQKLAEIATDGPLKIEAWAASADMGRLQTGRSVQALRPGTTSVVGEGHIVEVARQIDQRGAVRLVIEIDQDHEMPPPGEGLEVRVLLDPRTDALTVPEEALMVDGSMLYLFVLEPRGGGYTARQRLVVVGGRADGRVEIVDGVRAEERIAVRGAEWLADGLSAVDAGDAEADESKTSGAGI